MNEREGEIPFKQVTNVVVVNPDLFSDFEQCVRHRVLRWFQGCGLWREDWEKLGLATEGWLRWCYIQFLSDREELCTSCRSA